MNGDTKLKIKWGFIGSLVTLLLCLCGICYGYGKLNNRVDEIEKKSDCIIDIRERLARIEAILEEKLK